MTEPQVYGLNAKHQKLDRGEMVIFAALWAAIKVTRWPGLGTVDDEAGARLWVDFDRVWGCAGLDIHSSLSEMLVQTGNLILWY